MKTKRTTPKRAIKNEAQFRCRDCAHSYDWCNKALDGHLILCRCKFDKKSGHGKWCKFLSDPQCEHFQRREEA